MKKLFIDDVLIGGWAYARRQGISNEQACSIAVVQIELFIMLTLIPWLALLLKYLDFEKSMILYMVIGLFITLGIGFEIYVSKKNLFGNVDFFEEKISQKIRKCTCFFVFLLFYLPTVTYFLWPIIRQL
ncbi:hypothetical protein A9267_21115 [Shewanella sp. UCD-FRSSP16_17]|uniref:hypothetical protein n=1 Tax=Shewanella sp. UCD-FRSSP16_17 TaxID=1853256 RepID=UPI0007EEC4AD|nr:hypothetical protein [Shewanella sp. UCD-FRSSP16_17]OBT09338.1 hypothetical protein A9267_21115 [Shewanella sp. UCD-FRSSP16_17]